MRLPILTIGLCALAAAATNAQFSQAGQKSCGTGTNASICMGGIDRQMKLNPEQRARLSEVGTRAIDVISSPEYLRELQAFYQSYDWRGGDEDHRKYWQDFAPAAATRQTQASFNGLSVGTKGGIGGWFSATFGGNLAYEGVDQRDGTREFLLNRNRLNRPASHLAATYIHEASHKAGFSHRRKQNDLQKCEPPYVMGQIAIKLSSPEEWANFVETKDACSHWKR